MFVYVCSHRRPRVAEQQQRLPEPVGALPVVGFGERGAAGVYNKL